MVTDDEEDASADASAEASRANSDASRGSRDELPPLETVSTRLEGLKRELLSPRPCNPSTLNHDDWAAARERQQFVEQDRNISSYMYLGLHTYIYLCGGCWKLEALLGILLQ